VVTKNIESETKEVKPNLGNVAEGILVAAIAARFINKNEKIDKREVVSIIKELDKTKKLVVSKNKKVAVLCEKIKKSKNKVIDSIKIPDDTIFISSNLQQLEHDYLINNLNTQELNKYFVDAVNYVNKEVIYEKSLIIYNNGQVDKVMIDHIGLTGSKTDIKITFQQYKKPLIELDLDISLKTKGASTFGQASSAKFENINSLFKKLMKIQLSGTVKYHYDSMPSFVTGISYVYSQAVIEFNKKLTLNKKEAVTGLLAGIVGFYKNSNSGAFNVVDIGSSYKVYDPEILMKSVDYMSGKSISVTANNTNQDLESTQYTPPYIRIMVDNKNFLTIRHRPKKDEEGLRHFHYVESGPLLRELIKISSYANKKKL